MSFALEHDLTLALRLVGRISFFVWLRGGFAEAHAWLDAILPRADGQPAALLGRAHECAAVIAERLGDIEAQARHADAAYAAFVAVGDEQGMAHALRERGKTASARGDAVRADGDLHRAGRARRADRRSLERRDRAEQPWRHRQPVRRLGAGRRALRPKQRPAPRARGRMGDGARAPTSHSPSSSSAGSRPPRRTCASRSRRA